MAERKWFKGRAALAVDEWYSTGDVPANLAEAREYLRSDRSFADIVRELGSDGHGKDEFIHPLGRSRLQGPKFESVTRQGYLEAIGLALLHDPPVPIKTFWMTGAGNDEFEMHITDEAEHVSVTLFAPDVEGGTDDPGSPESWLVSIDDDGGVETRQTSGPSEPEPPSTRGRAAG
jgi:hypothetical protein